MQFWMFFFKWWLAFIIVGTVLELSALLCHSKRKIFKASRDWILEKWSEFPWFLWTYQSELCQFGMKCHWSISVLILLITFLDHFRQYDYGIIENLNKYEQYTPPEYNLTAITSPGLFLYASNDWISDNTVDVPRLYEELTNANITKYLVPVSSFNHLDYLIGKNVSGLVYQEAISYLENYWIVLLQ